MTPQQCICWSAWAAGGNLSSCCRQLQQAATWAVHAAGLQVGVSMFASFMAALSTMAAASNVKQARLTARRAALQEFLEQRKVRSAVALPLMYVAPGSWQRVCVHSSQLALPEGRARWVTMRSHKQPCALAAVISRCRHSWRRR
jgi:hypothetical protein